MNNLKDFLPVTEAPNRFKSELDELAKTVYNHDCLNNAFFDQWASRRFTAEEFSLFSINYFCRVHATTRRVAIALTSISDWVSRLEILHNLNDELGHGVAENVHVKILTRWIDAISDKLELPGLQSRLKLVAPLPATQEFIEETNALCAKDHLHAAGALLAQEWNGYTQLALLYEGSINYKKEFGLDEFHDISEYFYVHLGRAEKEHKQQATIIASRHCESLSDFKVIESSFNEYLNLLAKFWDSISDELGLI